MNYGGGIVKSARFTQSWGVSPGTGTLEVLGDIEPRVLDATTFTIGSLTLRGVVKKVLQKKENGTLWEITVADNRELLSWDHLECMFNMVEIVEADVTKPGQKRQKRFYSIYPDDWKALKKTYTKDKKGKPCALTASEILDKIFKAKTLQFDFGFEDHGGLSRAPTAVDARNGKELGALVQEVLDKVGLLMTMGGGDGMTLRFCVKGKDGTAPRAGINSKSISSGEALSNNPTQVRIIGDENLYQDFPVNLNPSWNRKWEEFVFEPAWLDEVDKVWGPFKDDVSGRAERVLKSRQVTVREFAEKKKEGETIAYADWGKWGEVGRMEIPCWVYLQEIVWKAYEIDRTYTLNGIDLFSLELREGLLSAVTYDTDGKLSYVKPEELYPETKAFIIMKGQPIDLTDPSKLDSLDPKQFEEAQNLWWAANRFHLDTKNYAVIFEDPIFVPDCPGKGGGHHGGGGSGSGSGSSGSGSGSSGSGSGSSGSGSGSSGSGSGSSGSGSNGSGGESAGSNAGGRMGLERMGLTASAHASAGGGSGRSGSGSGRSGSDHHGNHGKGGGDKGADDCGLFIFPNSALPEGHPARYLAIPNADAIFAPAEMRGSFCFAGEKYSKEFGSGFKRAAVFVGGLGYHALMEQNTWKSEVPYADGKGADDKANVAADACTEKQQTYKDGGLVNVGVCRTELNGCIDRVTYSLGITGLEEMVEYTKERPPSSFENERELERQKERGELYPGQRAERQEVEELSYWAKILKALKQGQQAKPYLNLNDVILKPLGNIHCSPTAIYPAKKVKPGDCIFKGGKRGEVNESGKAFAGVVTCQTSRAMAVPVATQGVVPVRITGKVMAGDPVGCKPSSAAASAMSASSKKVRFVGVVLEDYDGKHGEVLLPVRLGVTMPPPICMPSVGKTKKDAYMLAWDKDSKEWKCFKAPKGKGPFLPSVSNGKWKWMKTTKCKTKKGGGSKGGKS